MFWCDYCKIKVHFTLKTIVVWQIHYKFKISLDKVTIVGVFQLYDSFYKEDLFTKRFLLDTQQSCANHFDVTSSTWIICLLRLKPVAISKDRDIPDAIHNVKYTFLTFTFVDSMRARSESVWNTECWRICWQVWVRVRSWCSRMKNITILYVWPIRSVVNCN